jgi:carbamoylphosphate synthase large subunit
MKTNKPSFRRGDKVVFWGSRAILDTKDAIVYNSPEKLAKASKKGLARKIMKEEGIAIPKTEFNVRMARRTLDYPMIITPEKHRAGKHFFVAHNYNELTNYFKKVENGYISELFPKTKEYRVHVASGKALLVKQKPEPDDKGTIAWNFAENEKPWTTINRKDYDYDMLKLALTAVEKLGLDFGAVDIMSYPTDKNMPNHVVCEINTAPSYTPYLIEKYGSYFDKIFSMDTKLEPWDYSKFKKAKSFSWKNFQLKGEKNG